MNQAAVAPLLLALAASLLILPAVRPDQPLVRAAGAWLTAALLIRYMAWRFTDTLPPLDLAAPSLAAWGFFAVEASSAAAGLLLLHVLSKTGDRSAEADAHPIATFPGGPPLIDILIPTYNEDRDIVFRTIVGARAQAYPRFRVWVLDDGRRPWLARLAGELGAHYLTREDNRHGKAGNMNAGLRHLFGLAEPPDIIAVLDADFVAKPHFLARACALLHDPAVGAVQTPQHFFNPDPIQHNLASAHYVPDEQRFFFDIMMAAKDAHGTAFSCGTSSLVRAECLRLIGGFPIESVTEDLLLSIKLAGLGYRTAYLNEPLTAGLAPEGLREYLGQRGRWCLGVMQILRSHWGPFSLGPTPWRMRLHTLDTVLFWTAGSLMRLLCVLMPILYWWFEWPVMRADFDGIVANLGPYWVCSVAYLGWVSRGTNIPIIGDAIALLVCREAVRASAIGLFGRRDQTFKVTAKGATRDRVIVQWSLAGWFLAAAALTVGGIMVALLRGQNVDIPAETDAMTLLWSLYNVATLLIAALLCVERPRYRRQERFVVDEPGTIEAAGRQTPVRVIEMSLTGCKLAVSPPCALRIGENVQLAMPDAGAVKGRVRRNDPGFCYVAFQTDDEVAARLVRKLYSGAYFRPLSSANPFGLLRLVALRALGF
jgi:cellulose synthase (UDP-forming)